MKVVADASSLLAKIVMTANTAQPQEVLARWADWRQIVRPELTGRIAPTRMEGIDTRSVSRLPLARYAGQRPRQGPGLPQARARFLSEKCLKCPPVLREQLSIR